VDLPGPSYLRLGRKATPAVHPQGARFTLGKAMLLRPGADVTLIACGPYPVLTALAAHERLAALGVRARVLDMATVKPLDVAAVVDAATTTDGLVTVEEHNVLGGLGGAVAETLGEHAPARLRRIGMRDRFCTHVGDHEALLRTYGITEEAVTAAALEVLDVPSATVPEELNTP
jgi:transketolase